MINIILSAIIMFYSAGLSCADFGGKRSILNNLTPEEIAQVESGIEVLKTKDISGSAWPEITIYSFLKATPLESMAIFSALDHQKNYVPNVLKSEPIKNISSVEVLTEYELHVPFPLANAHYTHGSVVHRYDEDYELTWYMVKSTSADEVKGSAYFAPFKQGTLFEYRSYIRPKSLFASLVKKMMFKDIIKTVTAIKAHIEELKKAHSPLLTKYSGFITKSLQGEFVYEIPGTKK